MGAKLIQRTWFYSMRVGMLRDFLFSSSFHLDNHFAPPCPCYKNLGKGIAQTMRIAESTRDKIEHQWFPVFSLIEEGNFQQGCSNCGFGFCSNCLNHKVIIRRLADKPVSVCPPCYRKLTQGNNEMVILLQCFFLTRIQFMHSGKKLWRMEWNWFPHRCIIN